MTPPAADTVEHRYLQVARTLRKEIVDGVFPVGSQLPTEHELCERFAVSRYTVREALRRLRDDNLVSSRPRTGTLVVPRPSSSSYAQDVMSINDLLAFAAGARFEIESNAMVTITGELAERTGLPNSTVSRLTFTLLKSGYLVYDEGTGRYRMGVPVLSLGYACLAGMQVRETAQVYMQELADEAGDGVLVALGGRDDMAITYIAAARSEGVISLQLSVGSRISP